ncbi:hypothetical protein CAAN1_19S01222 [[Candida] anglica]|uniref:Uncharacterized protein n=1 Tax=[Candida] anglica TaxID=148631 RepID=A0ABP0E9L4_9ASCO
MKRSLSDDENEHQHQDQAHSLPPSSQSFTSSGSQLQLSNTQEQYLKKIRPNESEGPSEFERELLDMSQAPVSKSEEDQGWENLRNFFNSKQLLNRTNFDNGFKPRFFTTNGLAPLTIIYGSWHSYQWRRIKYTE